MTNFKLIKQTRVFKKEDAENLNIIDVTDNEIEEIPTRPKKKKTAKKSVKSTAKQNWEIVNKTKRSFIHDQSATKRFILLKAGKKELQMIKSWLNERENDKNE